MTDVPVLIVGGGMAGLAAAHALHKAGVPFRLLEKSARFGGVVRSDRVEGFLLEGGPDSLLALKPEGVGLARELGLGDRLVPTNPEARTVFVLHRRRLEPLPEGMMLAIPSRALPILRSRLFSWPGKIRMGLELFQPRRASADDESIASFLRRRFGQEVVERLGEPLLAGIHAGDPDRLSIRATFPRFVELEARHGSLIRGLKSAAPPRQPSAAAFYSLQGGLEEMVAALVARLPQESLSAQTPVASLGRETQGFRIGIEGGATLRARALVLAAPAPALADLASSLDAEAATALRAIRFASTATVLLGYRREQVKHSLDGYGLVVPRTEGLRTAACSFFSTKFPGRAPEGHVLLRGFLGGTRDPEVLDLDDAALVAILTREMAPVLGLQGDPVVTRIYRWPRGTPQMEVGHMDRMRALQQRVDAVPGLFLTGAGIRVTGIPDTIADGLASGAAAAAYLR